MNKEITAKEYVNQYERALQNEYVNGNKFDAASSLNMDYFNNIGFEIEDFGGTDISLRAIPLDLYGKEPKEMFLENGFDCNVDIAVQPKGLPLYMVKNRGFFKSVIVVCCKINSVLVDIGQHLKSHFTHTRLCISVGSRRITVD